MFDAISEDIIDEWFGSNSRLSKEDFMKVLSDNADKHLTPSSLRQLVRKKAIELNV